MISREHRRGSDVTIGRWCDNGVHQCFHLRCTYLYRPQLRIANSLYFVPPLRIGTNTAILDDSPRLDVVTSHPPTRHGA